MTETPTATNSIKAPLPDGYRPIKSRFAGLAGPFFYQAGPNNTGQICADIGPDQLNHNNVAHGGLLMALAEGLANQLAVAASGKDQVATASLNCDFLAPAPSGTRVTGTGRVTRVTTSLVFLTVELTVAGELVLMVTGVARILGTEPAIETADRTVAPSREPPVGYRHWERPHAFENHLAPYFLKKEQDGRVFAFRPSADHTDRRGFVDRGMLMTFADSVLGIGVFLASRHSCVTISQRTDFLRELPAGALVECRPQAIHKAETTVLVDGLFTVDGEPAFASRGLYRLLRSR